MKLKLVQRTTLAVLTLAVGISAQTVSSSSTEGFLVPGKTIRLTITFDGPDANRIEHAAVNFWTPSVDPHDAGLNSGSPEINGVRVSQNTFDFSWKIGHNMGTGTYQFSVVAGPSSNINRAIKLPEAFAGMRFTIRNPLKFSVGISDVKVRSDIP